MTLSSSPKLTTEAKTTPAEITLTHDLEIALKKNDLSAVETMLARFKNEFGKDVNHLEVSLCEPNIKGSILFEYLQWHLPDLQQAKNITKLLVNKKASLTTACSLVFDYTACAPDFTEFLVNECSVNINTSVLIDSPTLKKKEFSQHIVLTALGYTLDYLMELSVMPDYYLASSSVQEGTSHSQTAYEACIANLDRLLALGANVKRALPYILERYLFHDSMLHDKARKRCIKAINRIDALVYRVLRDLKCNKENSNYLKAILFSLLDPVSIQFAKLEAIDSSSPQGFKLLCSLAIDIISIIFKKEASTNNIRELIMPIIEQTINNIVTATTEAEKKSTPEIISLTADLENQELEKNIAEAIAQNAILEEEIASTTTNIKALQQQLQKHAAHQIQLEEERKKEINALITKHNTKKTEISAKSRSDQEQLTEIKKELSAIAVCKTTVAHLEKELSEINAKLSKIGQLCQTELANQKILEQIYQERDRELAKLNSRLEQVIAIKQQNLEQSRALQIQINEAEKALASDQVALETTLTELETEKKNTAALLQASDCTQLEAELLQYQQQCVLAEQEAEVLKEQERQQKIKMQSIATEGLMLATKLETLSSNQEENKQQAGEQKSAQPASYSPIFNFFPHCDHQPSLTRVDEQKISYAKTE